MTRSKAMTALAGAPPISAEDKRERNRLAAIESRRKKAAKFDAMREIIKKSVPSLRRDLAEMTKRLADIEKALADLEQ